MNLKTATLIALVSDALYTVSSCTQFVITPMGSLLGLPRFTSLLSLLAHASLAMFLLVLYSRQRSQ